MLNKSISIYQEHLIRLTPANDLLSVLTLKAGQRNCGRHINGESGGAILFVRGTL
jgi:hypothetical protein